MQKKQVSDNSCTARALNEKPDAQEDSGQYRQSQIELEQ